MTKVLAFGVFDGLHEGHKFFLQEAKKLGDFLIVVVTRDEAVKILKNKTPKSNENDRLEALKNLNLADQIVLGDSELGRWKIVQETNPDLVAIGYDQENLQTSLSEFVVVNKLKIALKKIPSYKPEIFKSSFINKNSPKE